MLTLDTGQMYQGWAFRRWSDHAAFVLATGIRALRKSWRKLARPLSGLLLVFHVEEALYYVGTQQQWTILEGPGPLGTWRNEKSARILSLCSQSSDL